MYGLAVGSLRITLNPKPLGVKGLGFGAWGRAITLKI